MPCSPAGSPMARTFFSSAECMRSDRMSSLKGSDSFISSRTMMNALTAFAITVAVATPATPMSKIKTRTISSMALTIPPAIRM